MKAEEALVFVAMSKADQDLFCMVLALNEFISTLIVKVDKLERDANRLN